MKPSFCSLIVAATISLLTSTPLCGQTATAKPPREPTPALPTAVGEANQPLDVPTAEKPEDAALLQQFDGKPEVKHQYPVWVGKGGGGGTAGMAYTPQSIFTHQAPAHKALLVRTSNPEPKAQATLEEDLAVMAHILNKTIEDLPGAKEHPMNALGVELFFAPGSAPMRSLYLDNYGAVFFLNVGFPLLAPPEKPQEEKPATDSAWEDARQELYGQHPQGAMAGEPGEDYSQEKVDKLKETLLETLKNATNIRELKPDEFVTVWVSGGADGGAGRFRYTKRNNNKANATSGANTVVLDQVIPRARRTILTIRVSKSDIDSYAKGKLSAGEFEKRAKITTYTGDPAGGPDNLVIGDSYIGRNRF
jgi:hypothetical protein